jgi:sulfur relay (sulfurtransferase) complex TusBCD TusD component (DsrE family)
MAKYTLIASRDAFESAEAGHYLDLAADLRKEGNEVTLFLVQNGVFTARKSARSKAVEALAGAGVTVLADAFSLRERGIPADRVTGAVRAADLDIIIDHMAEGRRVIWH